MIEGRIDPPEAFHCGECEHPYDETKCENEDACGRCANCTALGDPRL
jgi:hypothetical protein